MVRQGRVAVNLAQLLSWYDLCDMTPAARHTFVIHLIQSKRSSIMTIKEMALLIERLEKTSTIAKLLLLTYLPEVSALLFLYALEISFSYDTYSMPAYSYSVFKQQVTSCSHYVVMRTKLVGTQPTLVHLRQGSLWK